MVCGTASDVGKSHIVTGLCRLMHRRGVKIAPFKAQNMALNSYVTEGGHEIGRAQGVQALAAGIEPELSMNPILLKPTGECSSQVMYLGRPIGTVDAVTYQQLKGSLLDGVLEALADLRSRFDVVIAEGAGGTSEINLLDHDIVNLRVAHEAALPAILVGDIDRGGVFAALYGTMALLPEHYRSLVQGFVINKFRGDPTLLADGVTELDRLCGVPTLGVLPYAAGLELDAEDSLALTGGRPSHDRTALGESLDVVVVRFPRISNFTDLDALSIEPGVAVRFVSDPDSVGRPDLVVLPGTKSTITDLDWLRSTGMDVALERCRAAGAVVLGICGGYQMLGRRIIDQVESGRGDVSGLGWLDVETIFRPEKVTRRRSGRALGRPVDGYEIHHGETTAPGTGSGWIELDDKYGSESEGARDLQDGAVLGTNLHGLFEQDAFRSAFLLQVAARSSRAFVPAGVSFGGAREAQFERLADLIEDNLDMAALEEILVTGALR
ncbi:MAG: cobyric acid synthase [Acidimicrobiales bacterium]